jgi:signal transduction histidine kinase
MENLKQVTNDIAHDLRSPLARLRERLELAQRETRDPVMQAVFDDALSQVDGCLGIFAAMLRIAEVEAGARRRGFAPVDVSALLTGLAETFETVAEASNHIFHADIADGLSLHGDAELLTQMVVNVIENAIQHTPPGAHITLSARRNLGSLEVSIADNGPGVPAHERVRVLQRFVRLDTARHQAGSGLGLSLVHAVAALHDGDVTLLENAPGLKVVLHLACPP